MVASRAEPSNGIVTWKGVLLFIGSSIGVSVAATWVVFGALFSLHTSTTHEGSARREEFQVMREDVREMRQELRELRKENHEARALLFKQHGIPIPRQKEWPPIDDE